MSENFDHDDLLRRFAAVDSPDVDPRSDLNGSATDQPLASTGSGAPLARSVDDDVDQQSESEDGREVVLRSVRTRVRDEATTRMNRALSEAAREEEVLRILDRVLAEEGSVTPMEKRVLTRQVLADTLGYGPLDELMNDPSVSEIMCNGANTLYVERNGMLELTDLSFSDDDHLRAVINRIVRLTGRRVDESSPMVDARMADGSRLNAVLPPLALNGPVLTIRRFPEERLTADALVQAGTATPAVIETLEACVKGKLNVVVSGGTSTGKTTILNILSSFISPKERLITIEDSAELDLHQPHVITLESRPANAEGEGLVEIRDLVRNALRMRPDRLVIGECRGGEALDVLQAMNTGHDGSLTTVHANTARDTLRRLEVMIMMAGYDVPIWAIREQMASTLHLVVQMERLASGRRVIKSLTEVQSLEGDTILTQDLYVYDPAQGEVVATGLRPSFAHQLESRGITYPTPHRGTGMVGASR